MLERKAVVVVGTNEFSMDSITELPDVELNGSTEDSTEALVELSGTSVELAAESLASEGNRLEGRTSVEVLARDVAEYGVEVLVNVLIELDILLLAILLAGISVELDEVLSWVLAISLLARLSEEMPEVVELTDEAELILTDMLVENISIELSGAIELLLSGSLLVELVLVVRVELDELLGSELILVEPWGSLAVHKSVELITTSEVEKLLSVWSLLTVVVL